MLQLNFSPYPKIETENLILRQLEENDAAQLFLLRSSKIVMKYIDREKAKNIEDALTLIQQINNNARLQEGITWAICLKNNPTQLIGTIGFWRIIKQNFRAEVGYMLHPKFWNKGITKEALLGVIKFGFYNINLHSIEAHINPDNIASESLLLSVGFILEAYFKEDYYYNGQFLDTKIFSLLNK